MKNPTLVFIAAIATMIISAFTFSMASTVELQDKIATEFKVDNVEIFWSEGMADGEGRHFTYYQKKGVRCSAVFFERGMEDISKHNEVCGE